MLFSGFLFIFQLPAINGLRDIFTYLFFNLFSIYFITIRHTACKSYFDFSCLHGHPSKDPWHFWNLQIPGVNWGLLASLCPFSLNLSHTFDPFIRHSLVPPECTSSLFLFKTVSRRASLIKSALVPSSLASWLNPQSQKESTSVLIRWKVPPLSWFLRCQLVWTWMNCSKEPNVQCQTSIKSNSTHIQFDRSILKQSLSVRLKMAWLTSEISLPTFSNDPFLGDISSNRRIFANRKLPDQKRFEGKSSL